MTITTSNPFINYSYSNSFDYTNAMLQMIMSTPMPSLSSQTGYIPLFMPTIPQLTMPTLTFHTGSSALSSSLSQTAIQGSGKAQDLVSVARSYIGYNESDGSYLRFTNGRREAWCADFVSYCAKQAGVNNPQTSSVEGIRQWGKTNGRYSTTQAKVGDAVIFKNGMSHTGIIESISNGEITCIEGNTSDKVARRTYSINDPKISGFVSLA